MAMDMKGMDLSKFETRLFEQREQIDAVKKGLYQTVVESVLIVLALIFFSHALSKGVLVTVFAVYIGLVCVTRICSGLTAMAYKKIICKLMKRLDKRA